MYLGDVLGLQLFLLAGGGGGGAVDAGERLHVVDDDGDGIVLAVGALDAGVEDEPGAVVEGDGVGRSCGGEGLALPELGDAELVDGVLDEEAYGDAGAILREVGGVVGAVGGVEVGDAGVGVDLGGDVGGDGLVLDFFEGDDVGGVEDGADGERDLLAGGGCRRLGVTSTAAESEGLAGGDECRCWTLPLKPVTPAGT